MSFIYGFLFGLISMMLIVWWMMPRLMMKKRLSKLSFSDTVDYLNEKFTQGRWQVPKVYDIQHSLHQAGHTEAGKIKILSMCHPDYANEILTDDSRKFVSGMMPCRIGVYEDSRGNVHVSQMNVSLMSRMFGGVIQKVMAKVASEEEKIVTQILK